LGPGCIKIFSFLHFKQEEECDALKTDLQKPPEKVEVLENESDESDKDGHTKRVVSFFVLKEAHYQKSVAPI
jgi:hypothetical protein